MLNNPISGNPIIVDYLLLYQGRVKFDLRYFWYVIIGLTSPGKTLMTN